MCESLYSRSGETTEGHVHGGARQNTMELTPHPKGTHNSPSAALRTFLIADVRGYTSFTAEHGDQAAARLSSRFAELIEEVVVARGGQVIEFRGDEGLAVFSSARDTLQAAVELQSRFAEEVEKDPSLPLRVGIGLDAGEAIPVKGGYRGAALNRAARLCSVAESGDVFATEAVLHLAGPVAGLAVRDRGPVQLKGLVNPLRVLQVGLEGKVPADLPPLQLVVHPTNLREEPTTFVGREMELAAVYELLERPHVRLVTLTGAGGIGKTRIAQRVAAVLLDRFEDGVFFVNLAPISNPDLLLLTIAQVLNLQEVAGQPILTTLITYLQEKQILLVLDNFEQIVEAAPQVAEVVAACPSVKVLVTSRMVLHMYGEHEFVVPPLDMPDRRHLPSLVDLTQYEAVQLFIDRARMAKLDFAIREDSAAAIAGICHRLDGLPLGIELAAARVKVLPPQVLLARLGSRLNLLTGGARNLPARQQTLRHTIAWSYDLLNGAERVLFRRLGVFVGGCTLEAAQAVCDADRDLEIDLIDGLASLIDKSLLREGEGPGTEGYPAPRFMMLETIREFAVEQLEASGEADALRRHHAVYFSALADRAEPMLMSAQREPWMELLTAEHDNLRAMMRWSLAVGEPQIGLAVPGLLWIWYFITGPVEGRRWADDLLGHPAAQAPTSARAWGLIGAVGSSWAMGEPHISRIRAEEAVAIARRLNDKRVLAVALSALGLVTFDGTAKDLLEEARALFREQGSKFGYALATWLCQIPFSHTGDLATARVWLEEALTICRQTNDSWGQALSLQTLGFLSVIMGDIDEGQQYLEESISFLNLARDKKNLAANLLTLGGIARLRGDQAQAAGQFTQGLVMSRELGDPGNVAGCMQGLAGVAVARGQPEQAARLLGAAKALLDTTHAVALPTSDVLNAGIQESVQGALDGNAFDKAWAEGYAMTEEQAARYALDAPSTAG
jgi:predicted ATPase/class 3 adenylate cyclase